MALVYGREPQLHISKEGDPYLRTVILRREAGERKIRTSMKTTLWMLLVAVWTPGISLAQNSPGAASSKLHALEREWNVAYKAGDVTKMNSLLADDFIITIEDGRTFSKSGYIALNGNSTVRVDVSDMTDLKVRMHGNSVAVVTGAYHEKGVSQNKPYEYHDRFMDVWMMIEGKWQIIASQYSIPRPIE